MSLSQVLTCRDNQQYTFRVIESTDAPKLADYFTGLSEVTRKRFAPHPLTADYAYSLCQHLSAIPLKTLLMVIENQNEEIIGYFILDSKESVEEYQRYLNYQMDLTQSLDWYFAPCIAENYQNKGLSSACMQYIVKYAQAMHIENIILMGGTQKSNFQAIAFYEKNGFIKLGEFQTDVDNVDMYLPIQHL
ncbi:GNAT family N-acetyltransferase [Catenovulum sediminis]|uniref:GNAT family N-acetyltransferase n=1 Tax=Catenovulum sediminis TaxID=1740262 RepID=UPI00118088C8|nr:GNAT family N-acetyltransferase [Catenovulum sediminis]